MKSFKNLPIWLIGGIVALVLDVVLLLLAYLLAYSTFPPRLIGLTRAIYVSIVQFPYTVFSGFTIAPHGMYSVVGNIIGGLFAYFIIGIVIGIVIGWIVKAIRNKK